MRLLYTSPRQDNVDRVIALMAEHGIETRVTNRSNWNKPSYQRTSYQTRNGNRDSWPQVWVVHADDHTRARELLRELGVEPAVRFAEELGIERSPAVRRQSVAVRIRRIVLVALAAAFLILMLRYLGKI